MVLLGRAAVLIGLEQTLKHGLPLAFAQWNADAAPHGFVLPTITSDAVEIHPEALPKIKALDGDSDALCRITSSPGGSFVRHGAQGGDRSSNFVISIAIRHRTDQSGRKSPAVLEIFANAVADAVQAALRGLPDDDDVTVCLDGLPYGVWGWDEQGAQVDFLTAQDTTSEPTGLLCRIEMTINHTAAY